MKSNLTLNREQLKTVSEDDWIFRRCRLGDAEFRSHCSGMWRGGDTDKNLTRDRDDSEFMRRTSRQLIANASVDDEILVLTSSKNSMSRGTLLDNIFGLGSEAMQLYHHPYSLDSQRVRLALEEKGIDYTSYHVNPITGKHMDSSFFRMNPNAKLPVFRNAEVSSGVEDATFGREVLEWMRKIREWDSKLFTLAHIPDNRRLYVSKFLRMVMIARMAESPDLASAYHRKLREAYDTEDKLKDPEALRRSKDHLLRLLDEVETKLEGTSYVAGNEFSMADVMLVPVLARLSLLDLEEEYISSRRNLAEYWVVVRSRPSYKKVIGRYFNGWRKYATLLKTWMFVRVRSLLRKY
ncbi:hypothetical protein HID58_027976 [Brassica napus]|uniref:Glutathione S-transferase TCHQD n=1 Tax=Brassica napus TaxID=3708 RepID=A0ABQ8CVM2_BRANA|nr:hypothetical protein HID58_027976 [Brassica napus]